MLNEIVILGESSSDSINAAEFLANIPAVNSIVNSAVSSASEILQSSFSLLSDIDAEFPQAEKMPNMAIFAPARARFFTDRSKSAWVLGIAAFGAFGSAVCWYSYHQWRSVFDLYPNKVIEEDIEEDIVELIFNSTKSYQYCTALVSPSIFNWTMKKDYELMIYNFLPLKNQGHALTLYNDPSKSFAFPESHRYIVHMIHMKHQTFELLDIKTAVIENANDDIAIVFPVLSSANIKVDVTPIMPNVTTVVQNIATEISVPAPLEEIYKLDNIFVDEIWLNDTSPVLITPIIKPVMSLPIEHQIVFAPEPSDDAIDILELMHPSLVNIIALCTMAGLAPIS